MAETTNKMFLDKTGLATLWGIIKDKFSTKAETISSVAINSSADNVVLTFAHADSTVATQTITLSAVTAGTEADQRKAGLMTPEMLDKLNTAAGGTIANLKFNYLTADENTAEGDLKGKPVIQLWDGEKSVLTQLDATEFVKDGMLKSANLVLNPDGYTEGTYIELVWNTDAGDRNDNVEGVQDTMYINVSEFFKPYTAGDGISIDNNNKISCTYKYELPIANDTTLGGVMTGYKPAEGVKEYALQADSNGKAYVAVPWKEYARKSDQDQTNNLVKLTLEDTTFGINEEALTTRLSGIDTAVKAKVESVDTTDKTDAALLSVSTTDTATGKAVTIDPTTKLTTAVGLAETSVQGVASSNTDVISITAVEGENNKYSFAAGTKLTNAISAAETAVQTVKIGDLTFTKADGVASVAHDDFVGHFAMTEDDIKAICVF